MGIKQLLSQQLETTFYHMYSPKIAGGTTIRILVLSDLHNYEFGSHNQELVEQAEKLKPDIIVMAGDMVNKEEDRTDVAVNLGYHLSRIAPVYYGLGNHEGTMIYVNGIALEQELENAGVEVLVNRWIEKEIRGTPIMIGGISGDVENYELYSKEFVNEFEVQNKDAFKILITHFPDLYYEKLKDVKIDLGICGHFHGGQIQLPGAGGLYSVDYGLFPKYCNGMFQLENCTIAVSRGLGNSHSIPRINNRPELMVIDVNARMLTE